MTGATWRVLVLGALALLAGGCGSESPGGSTSVGSTAIGTAPSGGEVVTVMPIGDSITAGPYYWPHLARAVAAADCPVDFIGTFTGAGDPPLPDAAQLDLDHQAVGGATSDEIIEQLDDSLQEQPAPDIALVYLGTNDFFTEIERSTTIENVEEVVHALRRVNPEVSILLAQIMPAVGVESGIQALNARVDVLAQRLDTTASPVEIVDMASGVRVERDLVDGVHPSDARSRELAARWVEALGPLLGERCRL